MKVVLDALTAIIEGKNIYPKIGLTVFKVWVIIFAFVGIQFSWNMRPFLGTKDMPFQLFRSETTGNFYSTVFAAFGNLIGVSQEGGKQEINSQDSDSSREETIKPKEESRHMPVQ